MAVILSFSFSCSKENNKTKTANKTESSEQAATSPTENTKPPRTTNNDGEKEITTGSPIGNPKLKMPKNENEPNSSETKDMDNTIGTTQGSAINFPMNQGNYWVYTSKNYKNGALGRSWETKNTITKVEGPYVYVNGQKVYKIEKGIIYRTSITRGGGEINGLYFFMPKESKEKFNTLVSGDVLVVGSVKKAVNSITVPAGTYSDCLVFNLNSETIYVVPGIGIIKKVEGKEGDQFYQTEELTSYSLK